MKLSITKVLRSENWIAVNKDMAKVVGCNAVYLLGYLCEKYEYRLARKEITEDGYFYAIAADVLEDIGLTTHEQDTAIKRLVSADMLTTKLKGMPAKKHYKITPENEAKIYEVIIGKPKNTAKVAEKSVENEPMPTPLPALDNAENKFSGNSETSLAETAKQVSRNAQNKFGGKCEALYKDTSIKNNSVENKFSTDKHKEEAREFFEEKTASQNLVEVADHVAENTPTKNTKKKAQEAGDYRNFDEECENRGFSKIAKIPKRYTSQQMAAKIAEVGVGEAIFWTMIERVECYLCENPKKKYQNLPAVVITWFGTADENAIKNALNSFWREKYKADYQILTNWSDAQKTAIKSISSQLKHAVATRANKIIDKVSTSELESAAKTFFLELPEKWANLKWFKLENIANDFSAIMASIKDEREKAKKAKTTQVQEEQPKEKTFGEKCAEVLQGVTPAVAADVAQRLAQPTRFNFTKDVDNKAIKAMVAMVAWASQNNRVISSDIEELFDMVDDFYTHIKAKKDAATK